MSQDKQKSIAAMRTFARDLDRERDDEHPVIKKPGSGDTTPSPAAQNIPKKHPPAPTPKMGAIKAMPNVAPTPDGPDFPEHIPAFHELAKKHTSKVPEKTNVRVAVSNTSATIITDTKKAKRSFIKDVTQSMSQWFVSVQKQLKRREKKSYTVTDTTRRKGVVQKATSKTGTMFSADNETLMAEIKKRQREKEIAHDDEEEILWTPFTESGYALLEGEETVEPEPTPAPIPQPPILPEPAVERMPIPEPPQISIPLRKRVLPTPVAPTPTTPAPALVDESVLQSIEKEVAAPTPPPPVAPVPNTQPTPPPNPTLPVAIPVPEPTETDEPEPQEPELENTLWRPGGLANQDTNVLTVLIVGILLAIAIIGFLVFIFTKQTVENTPGVFTSTTTSLIAPLTQVQTITIQESTAVEMFRTINTAFLQSTPGQHVEFIFKDDLNRDIAPRIALQALRPENAQVFAQSITAFHLFKTETGGRALVFKTKDSLSALGGILDWESSLYKDTRPFFTTSVVENTKATFSDLSIKQNDVRVLKDGNDILLVYGFINDSTIVVANSLETFITLSEL